MWKYFSDFEKKKLNNLIIVIFRRFPNKFRDKVLMEKYNDVDVKEKSKLIIRYILKMHWHKQKWRKDTNVLSCRYWCDKDNLIKLANIY